MTAVPAGWTTEPFSSVATYSAGRTPARARAAYWSGDSARYPWVAISDMDEYGHVSETKEMVTEQALQEVFRGRVVPAGTLLMSFKLTIGRVATLGVPAFHNEAIIAIYPREDVDQRYLGYFLSHFDYSELQDRAIKGQTLNQDKIDRIPVLLPPADERTAIADVLDLVRRGIRAEERGENVAREMKQVAMHNIFTCGLRSEAQKETEFGPVPSNWRIADLADVATVQTGVAKGRALRDAEVVEVPYLRVANVQDGHLDLREMKRITIRTSEIERYRLEPGDVVLTEGGDFDKLGRGFVWNGEVPGCVHQNHVFAVRTDRDVLVPTFLAYLAQSPYGKAYFLKVAHKTTNLACINTTKLKALPVLIPDLTEQEEIVGILDAIDRKIDLHRRKKAVLEELFKSLLHKLMTGEIRVADLDLSALPAMPDVGEEART